MRLTRRRFIAGSALLALGAGGAVALPGADRLDRLRRWLTGTPALRGTVLSAFEDARGDQYVGGVRLDDAAVFGARVPMRAHGCAPDPRDPQRALFFARRPGTQAVELRLASAGGAGARVRAAPAFETGAGRHLSGHGAFSPDGELLFVPEYDYERVRGLLTVRDARTYRVLHEIDTQGIDPHDLAWWPAGSGSKPRDGRRLLVANGGILTHPRSFRRKLNIPTMDPSLCTIDARSGACVEQWRLPDHLLSIRHLAIASDGGAVAGLQYEGDPAHAPGVVALLRPGAGLQLLTAPAAQRQRFKGYVASVALSEPRDLIAAACPYGGGVACWSLREGRYLGFVAAHEPYGLSQLADGRVLASQRDGTAFDVDETRRRAALLHFDSGAPIRWDDHWVCLA